MKKFKGTIIAFVVLVALMVYANYWETSDIPLPGLSEAETLVEGDFNSIRSVEWIKGKAAGLKLVKERGKNARIVSPKEYAVDSSEANVILSSLAGLESQLIIEGKTKEEELSVYGITASSPSILVVYDKGNTELTLGSQLQVGSQFYIAKKGSSKVYVVGDRIEKPFTYTLDTLRDHRLYVNEMRPAVSVAYRNNDTELCIECEDSHGGVDWKIVSPTKYNADNGKVDSFLSQLNNLVVSKFIEDEAADLSKYGLDKPSLEIVLKDDAGESRIFKAGSMQGTETYVTENGKAVYAVLTTSVNDLRHSLSFFRDKFVQLPKLNEIKSLVLSDLDGEFNIVSDGELKWKLGEKKVHHEDLSRFITEFSRTEIAVFSDAVDLEAKLIDKEIGRKAVFNTESGIETWYLGDIDNGGIWVSNGKECFMMSSEPTEAFDKLMSSLRAL